MKARRVGLKLAGAAVLTAALWFLARTMTANWAELGRWRPAPEQVAALIALAAAYAVLLMLLAEAWHRICGVFGDEPRERTWRSYTTTLVARYLPGNVLHLAGRAAMLRGGSLDERELGRATALELVIVPGGAILALLCLWPLLPMPLLPDAISQVVPVGGPIAAAGLIAVLALAAPRPRGRSVLRLGPVLGLATLFMLGLGGVFAVVAATVSSVAPSAALPVAIVAWVAGYVAPGAPGGVGAREAMLVAMAGALGTSDGEALLAAILFRIVTMSGELFCFAGGLILPRGRRRVRRFSPAYVARES